MPKEQMEEGERKSFTERLRNETDSFPILYEKLLQSEKTTFSW